MRMLQKIAFGINQHELEEQDVAKIWVLNFDFTSVTQKTLSKQRSAHKNTPCNWLVQIFLHRFIWFSFIFYVFIQFSFILV